MALLYSEITFPGISCIKLFSTEKFLQVYYAGGTLPTIKAIVCSFPPGVRMDPQTAGSLSYSWTALVGLQWTFFRSAKAACATWRSSEQIGEGMRNWTERSLFSPSLLLEIVEDLLLSTQLESKMHYWMSGSLYHRGTGYTPSPICFVWQLRSQVDRFCSISWELLFCQFLWNKKEQDLPSPTAENRNFNSFVLLF